MPIPLGILAVAGAGGGAAPSDFELLESTILSSQAASITFSNLSNYSTYTHLQIRFVAKTVFNGNDSWSLRLNGNTGNNYNYSAISTTGSTVSASNTNNAPRMTLGNIPGSDTDSNIYTAGIIDFIDCHNTNKAPSARTIQGWSGLDHRLSTASGYLNVTGAISSIQFFSNSGDLAANTRLSLYGLKG